MIKHILSKIPRTSHGDSRGAGGLENGSNSSNDGPKPLRSSSVALAAAKKANRRKKLANVTGQGVPLPIPGLYEALPSFRDVPRSEKRNLLIGKLNMCCVVFDFTYASTNLEGKDVKRQTLLELVDHVSSVNFKFDEPVVMHELTKMVAVNLFRSLPSPSHENIALEAFDLDEEEPAMDPAWPHVQIVYELLLRFVSSSKTDAKLAKRFVDRSFVLRLLDLFDSEDPRERDYLKTILHQIYSKFTVYRPFIRRAINNVFYQFVFETERHNGISELLEILGSVINGFSLPLKEEHKLFLVRCLIPLHKPTCLSMYQQQLSFCIMQFMEKDVKLADTVIQGLLKYWPVTNSSKEVTFITVLEEVIEVTQATELRRCMIPLFRQISRCLNSFHFQVAERTLVLLNNDRVRNLVIQNHRVILPVILPALEQNARSHWNQSVQGLALDLKKVFANADQAFFDECREIFEEDEIKSRENQEKHVSSWKFLEELANSKRASKEANLCF